MLRSPFRGACARGLAADPCEPGRPRNYFYAASAFAETVAAVQCPNCRAVASPEAAFCANCGASLGAMKVAASASPLPMPSVAGPSPLPTPMVGGAPVQPSPPPAAPQPPPAPMPSPPPYPGPYQQPPQAPPLAAAPPTAGAAPPPQGAPSPISGIFGPAPPAPSPQAAAMRQMAKDAFPMRLMAFLVDAVICGFVSWILAFVWVSLFFLGTILFWWSGAIVLALYMLLMEGSSGQTIGKMLFGLKVVREDAGPLGMEQAQWRAFGILLYPLVVPAILDFLWALEQGQTLGDRWAHTTVVRVQG